MLMLKKLIICSFCGVSRGFLKVTVDLKFLYFYLFPVLTSSRENIFILKQAALEVTIRDVSVVWCLSVSGLFPAAALKTFADTSKNSAVQLFSIYYNFLMWFWFWKHPKPWNVGKMQLENSQILARRTLSLSSVTQRWNLSLQILKGRKMETRRSIISCFLKYQRLFLVDGNVGGRKATAAAAVPELLPGDKKHYLYVIS